MSAALLTPLALAAPAPGLVAAFWVAGVPVPWRPPRVTRGGRHTYTPAHVRAWQRAVRKAAEVAMGGRRPWRGPVVLTLDFARRPTLARPAERWWAQRPDWVNLAKGAEDALNRVVFADDCQVVSAHVTKRRGPRDGLTVRVGAL